MNTPSDHELIAKTLGGDAAAFRGLVVRHQEAVFRVLGGLLVDRAAVEDAAQETFLRAYRQLTYFDNSGDRVFLPWLLTIARHLALSTLKRRNARQRREAAVALTDPPSLGDHRDEVERRWSAETVRASIAALPKRYRSAVALAYLEGLSLEEIADIEGCAKGTVKSRIFRGKQRLAKLLSPRHAND